MKKLITLFLSVQTEIQRFVEYMGGIFTKQLRTSVTHLITDIVMSAKYEVNGIFQIYSVNYCTCK